MSLRQFLHPKICCLTAKCAFNNLVLRRRAPLCIAFLILLTTTCIIFLYQSSLNSHIKGSKFLTNPSIAYPYPPVSLPTDIKVSKKPRVLCLILTHKKYFSTRATAVNYTWAQMCDGHYFIVSENDEGPFPLMKLKLIDSYINLWDKVRTAFTIAHDRYINDYDFFMKADDDTYVFVRNLKLYLQGLDSKKLWYVGRKFTYPHTPFGYCSGGAGYVLSRATLRKMVADGVRGSLEKCQGKTSITDEDVALGHCMRALGIAPTNAIDKTGKELFHPFSLEAHVDIFRYFPNPSEDFYSINENKNFSTGLACCTQFPISFHYIPHRAMLTLHYLLYFARLQVNTTSVISSFHRPTPVR